MSLLRFNYFVFCCCCFFYWRVLFYCGKHYVLFVLWPLDIWSLIFCLFVCLLLWATLLEIIHVSWCTNGSSSEYFFISIGHKITSIYISPLGKKTKLLEAGGSSLEDLRISKGLVEHRVWESSNIQLMTSCFYKSSCSSLYSHEQCVRASLGLHFASLMSIN